MKKLILTLSIFTIIGSVNAQEAKTKEVAKPMESASSAQPQMSKEQKEANLVESFKRAELSEEQQKKAREIMAESSAKNKEVKADTKLTEEEKKVKFKANADDKNAKLKELMGEAKYKAYTQAQKALKEAVQMAAPVKE